MSIVEYTIKKNSKSWPKIHCCKCDKFIRPVDAEELEKWPFSELCKECIAEMNKEADLTMALRDSMVDFLRSSYSTVRHPGLNPYHTVDTVIGYFIELMRAYESNK